MIVLAKRFYTSQIDLVFAEEQLEDAESTQFTDCEINTLMYICKPHVSYAAEHVFVQ